MSMYLNYSIYYYLSKFNNFNEFIKFFRESSPFSIQGYQTQNGQSSYGLTSNAWQLEQRVNDGAELTAEEYVCMIRDTLNMGKNICLCRHFHLLDKEELFK